MPSHTALPGNAMPTAPLDTRYQIETPEGIDLPLRPAGLMPRALAFGFDLGLRGLILGILFIALAFLGNLGIGLGSILLFFVSWWYMVLFEVLNQGCSPGKQVMGLRVVQDDGTPIGWSASLIRNLLRFVDMLPFGYFLGAISCLQHPHFKRLGDIFPNVVHVLNADTETYQGLGNPVGFGGVTPAPLRKRFHTAQAGGRHDQL